MPSTKYQRGASVVAASNKISQTDTKEMFETVLRRQRAVLNPTNLYVQNRWKHLHPVCDERKRSFSFYVHLENSCALAFGLVTFAQTLSSHIALLGGPLFCQPRKRLRMHGHWGERFEGGFWKCFRLRFAFTAMPVSVLVEFLWFGAVFDLFLFRLQDQGEAFRRCICELFWLCRKQHSPNSSHTAFNTAPKSPKLAPRWHQRDHKIAVLDPQKKPT